MSPHVVFHKCEFPYLSTSVSPSIQALTSQAYIHTPSPVHFVQLHQSHGQTKTIYNVFNPTQSHVMPSDISTVNIAPF